MQNHSRWVLLRYPTQNIPTCWYILQDDSWHPTEYWRSSHQCNLVFLYSYPSCHAENPFYFLPVPQLSFFLALSARSLQTHVPHLIYIYYMYYKSYLNSVYSINIYIHYHYYNCTYSLKPIFHCNANPFALEPRVGLDTQPNDFALEIPTCWYLKNLVVPTGSPMDLALGHTCATYIPCCLCQFRSSWVANGTAISSGIQA